jgi:two-component system, response regulator YesN
MDERVRTVIFIMRDSFHREISLDNIAQVVNLSTWHLSHLFKVETGEPPIQYLKRLRMQKAKELLETTFLSVKEISGKVGLMDESHFVRNFKKKYGRSPTKHRAYHLAARSKMSITHDLTRSANE